MSAELIAKMRGRIDQCRRLAKSTTDARAAEILRQMADEGEADLRKLQAKVAAEQAEQAEQMKMPPPAQG